MYDLKQCEKLIDTYIDMGGSIMQIEDGCLGLGTLLLHDAPGKKSILIKERFLNEWSSTHTIRQYNKLPKKYAELVGNS